VIGIGDEPAAAIARRGVGGPREDLTKIAPGVCMDSLRWPALQGPHNAQNAARRDRRVRGAGHRPKRRSMTGWPACRPAAPHGAGREFAWRAVRQRQQGDQPGSPPRRRWQPIPRIHWILGGKAKTDNLDACRPGFGMSCTPIRSARRGIVRRPARGRGAGRADSGHARASRAQRRRQSTAGR
jgi:UDP-N-acetylmuramoylalanine--D-glutamate ligase